MKIVVPLRVETVAAQFLRANQTDVIQRAFSDDINAAIELGSLLVDGVAQFFEKIQGGMIEDGVHGIEAECVNVKIADPFHGVGYEEMPDLVAVRVVEIERGSPRRPITVREIGAELREVVSLRTNVVV